MALPLAVEAALAPDEVRRAPTGPGLLDANQTFCVFLRRWTLPDGPFTCGDCR